MTGEWEGSEKQNRTHEEITRPKTQTVTEYNIHNTGTDTHIYTHTQFHMLSGINKPTDGLVSHQLGDSQGVGCCLPVRPSCLFQSVLSPPASERYIPYMSFTYYTQVLIILYLPCAQRCCAHSTHGLCLYIKGVAQQLVPVAR